MTESKFLLLWILVWTPIASTAFVLMAPNITALGNFTYTWALFLGYVYLLFSPAIYIAFFRNKK